MADSKSKQVVIKSNVSDRLSISQLNVLQGNLKELPDENYKKLRRSILKHGFFAPMFVWESQDDNKIYLLDGTQRYTTLNMMKKEGYKIPQVPVIFIDAEDVDDAKSKLAAVASQFGQFTAEGVEEFFASFKFNEKIFDTIQIPTLEMTGLVPKNTTEVSAHEREISNTSKEVNLGDFSNFQHECPKCGFEWNSDAKT